MMAPETSVQAESIASSSSSSSISSLSSVSGNTLLTLSKVELDRLIAQNMTSVLKSLKKRKHAKKHARIRQAAAEAAAVEEKETMAENEGHRTKGKEKPAKRPKKGLDIVRRRISPRKHNLAQDADSDDVSGGSNQPRQPAEKNGKENKTINAFQLMMGARGKSIGSNSPGKDLEQADSSPSMQTAQLEKAKRKLKLQQWAEQKGSGKRKLHEEAEGEYIEHQLKKRAKRLKKLIGNMELPEEQLPESSPASLASTEPTKHTRRKQQSKAPTASSARRSSQSKHSESLPADGCEGAQKVSKTSEKVVQVIDILGDSDDEFLQQLSSPRKKKDSLFGYFHKMASSGGKKDLSSETKPSATATPNAHQSNPDVENAKANTSPTSSRPRRACANRIKDYAAFGRCSPEKGEHKSGSKKPPVVTPLKIVNVQSPNAMKVVRSPSLQMFSSNCDTANRNGNAPLAEWSNTPKSVKLAPLFSRATVGGKQAPVVDPEMVRARQLFLMSGIPEKMRQDMDKRASYEEHVLNESPVFPLVSHVTQLGSEELRSSGSCISSRKMDLRQSCIKLRPEEVESTPPRGKVRGGKSRKIRYGLLTACSAYDYAAALLKCIEPINVEDTLDYQLPEIENVKEIVRDYKQRYQHFPVFKCYKQFRTIYLNHQLEQSGENGVEDDKEKSQPVVYGKRYPSGGGSNGVLADDSIEIVEPTFHCRNGEWLFTEKYKPQNTEQILVNYVPATLLKRFLSAWQDDGTGLRRTNNGSVASSHGDYFSSNATASFEDDFEVSNGSTTSSVGGVAAGICNHVVLVGPPGCGKTCTVYAVATEMNFNVLEINASSRRKGKIILQELLESTQSHQVRQKSERSNSLDGYQKSGGKKGGLLNGGLRLLQRRTSFSETNGNGAKKLSLILIEDADIVFEQDDGFLGAINQLVATSKRPIVLTTTNPSCTHMARYMARNNVIQYVAPGIANVAKFLSLLALVERIPIDQHDLGRLYAHNGKDMRKTLNELQFFIQSGGDMERFVGAPDVGAHDVAEASDAELNETRDEECEQAGMDDESSQAASAAKGSRKTAKNDPTTNQDQHGTLYRLFTRNQNVEMVLRLPLEFDTLWCNMELVLRRATVALAGSKGMVDVKKQRLSTPKRPRRRDSNENILSQEVALSDDLSFLYENISRAEASWGVTQRNRVRYGRDLQDEQQQQQMGNEMRHALIEGSWIDWFNRRRLPNGRAKEAKRKSNDDEEKTGGAKAYDSLRKLEQEQRQTIASYIGVSGIRSRVTACDYEPLLRQICRHERDRSSQERRGSRFYHYLRNFASSNTELSSTFANGTTSTSTGFSVDHFDALSHHFEESQREVRAVLEELEVEK